MAREGIKDQPYTLVYETDSDQTGLTDVLFTVFDPTDTQVAGSPFTGSELASTAVYKAVFTPDQTGTYVVLVNSASSSPSIVNKAGAIEVVEDLRGATYDSSTDSLEAIRDRVEDAVNSSGSPTAGGRLV